MVISYDEDVIRSEAVALLRDLLRVDTSNPPGNETPAAELLQRYLEGAGIACELVARDPLRANLVARIPGTGDGPTLTLLGHTDVVPADEPNWTHPPFDGHLDDAGYMWGRGATDMKNETATRAVTMALLARGGFRPAETSGSLRRQTRRTAAMRSASNGCATRVRKSAPTSRSTRVGESAKS